MRIKEIRQIVEYSPREFLPHLTKEVEEMQERNLDVEIQYGCTENIYSAIIVGRVKTNASPKTIR